MHARRDLNPQPLVLETSALPLCYGHMRSRRLQIRLLLSGAARHVRCSCQCRPEPGYSRRVRAEGVRTPGHASDRSHYDNDRSVASARTSHPPSPGTLNHPGTLGFSFSLPCGPYTRNFTTVSGGCPAGFRLLPVSPRCEARMRCGLRRGAWISTAKQIPGTT